MRYAFLLVREHMLLALPMAVATFFIFLQIGIWAERAIKAKAARRDTFIERRLKWKR